MKQLQDISIADVLIKWYLTDRRDLPWRRSSDPYAIWVSEVMLQQTQVKTVIPYFKKFMRLFPTIGDLAGADLQLILKAWEGLGYYARARNLHRAAAIVMAQYSGEIPDDWKRLRALPGVGDYIASALLSIAFGHPFAVVDGNVKRVLARLFALTAPVNRNSSHRQFQETADRLLDSLRPGDFNQAIMELGALICTPQNPACRHCPLHLLCKAYQTGSATVFPVREKKAPTPRHHIAIGVIRKNGRILITRRKEAGLLGGLWEFPGGKIEPGETSLEALKREILEETGLGVADFSFLTHVRHAYTHFKIEAEVFICSHVRGKVRLNGPTDHRWIYPSQIDQFPFPKANHKFIPKLLEWLAADKAA